MINLERHGSVARLIKFIYLAVVALQQYNYSKRLFTNQVKNEQKFTNSYKSLR